MHALNTDCAGSRPLGRVVLGCPAAINSSPSFPNLNIRYATIFENYIPLDQQPSHGVFTMKSVVSQEIFINAPLAIVWDALADIRLIGRWRSKSTRCRLLTGVTTGVGARRRLESDEGGYSIEEVVEWDPLYALVLQTVETDSAYDDRETAFRMVEKNAGTLVTATMRYSVPYGLFGIIMDFLSTKALTRTHLKLVLKGLKHHVEVGPGTGGSAGSP